MKNLFFILAVVVLTSSSAQTSFKTFYTENNQDADLSLGLNTSFIANFISNDNEDIKELVKKSKHTRIMVFSDDWEYTNSKFNKFIKRSKYDKLMKIREDNDNVTVYILEQKELIKEIVVQISTGDELVLLGLKTNLTYDDLARILNNNDISFN